MAIKTYVKGTATKLSDNFKSTEFDCHGNGCCLSTLIDDDLVNYLQKIRNYFGKPVNITSGYRCSTHNKNVGGATGSRHTKGQAADISITGIKPAEIAKYAESIGILGIGLYETNSDGHFVHIDTRTTKSFWYGQAEASRSTFGGTVIKNEEEKKIDTSKVVTSAADPQVIWNFFKSQGLNDFGIAGLMGNLEAESGLKPINLQNTYEKKLGYSDAEYTAAVDQGIYSNFVNDSAGYGLAQWTYYSRKQKMLDFHQKKKKSIGDLNTQLEFLAYELSNNYKTSVWEVLKKATSVLEASNAVLLKFECPADQSVSVQNTRAKYGQNYYNKYAEKKINTTTQTNTNGGTKMKYSASNKPLVCMQTQSTCYKGTSKMAVKGVLWHSTGANNPNLKRYVQPSDNATDKNEMLKLLGTNSNKNDWNHISQQAGLNCWIGKLADGTVTTVQTMPWDFKPWGCGSGPKGSCNNGWIQFEICEDGLTDKTYFNKVYKEACEITAYLCKLYNIDPEGTVTVNGVKIPTILCHADANKLGFGSNHGDVNHWFPKHGKSMETARADVKALMGNSQTQKVENSTSKIEDKLYRVRTSWEDVKSQIGAYTKLENAKEICDKTQGYYVFNSKGEKVYPEEMNDSISDNELKVGDEVSLVHEATYTSGKAIPSFVFNAKLYLREFKDDKTKAIISTLKSGAITGIVFTKDLVKYGSLQMKEDFKPYIIKVECDVLNVRAGAGTQFRVNSQIRKNEAYTIVAENKGWGKLKSGIGWINLEYTKKIR